MPGRACRCRCGDRRPRRPERQRFWRRRDGLEALAIGIGIHLGAVTFGNIGSPDRLDFTVIAPTVNVASRVQDLCKPLGESILITAPVAERADMPVRSLGFHPLKGLGKPIEVFGLQAAG